MGLLSILKKGMLLVERLTEEAAFQKFGKGVNFMECKTHCCDGPPHYLVSIALYTSSFNLPRATCNALDQTSMGHGVQDLDSAVYDTFAFESKIQLLRNQYSILIDQ